MPTVEDLVAAAPTEHGVVIAGPGTGKTHRIGERISSLLTQDVNLDDIVVVTLTNETVRALQERLPTVPIRTMHSYALARLNEIGDATRRRPADKWEERYLVSPDIKALSGIRINVDKIPKFLKRLGAGFRTTAGAVPDLTPDEEALRGAWLRVREFLLLRLFDELSFDLLNLMRDGHELARPPKSILVDEYQDLTPVELELIHEISDRYGAGVFGAGDDRQSIYGFREADPLGLNNFSEVYGTDGPAFMSKSFRCPGRVLALAEAVASHMPVVPGLTGRPPMESSDDLGDGEVQVATFKSIQAETAFLVKRIARRLAETAAEYDAQEVPEEERKRQVAVIVPRGVEIYEAFLNEASEDAGLGLTFRDSRSPSSLASDLGFRFLLALLRVADDADDELAWRALVHLAPGIGATRLETMYAGYNRLTVALRGEAPLDGAIRTLFEAVEQARAAIVLSEDDAALRDAVATAADAIGFSAGVPWDEIAESVEEGDPETTTETPPHRVLLAACQEMAHRRIGEEKPAENEIRIYTIHAAKGQQWHHVFIAGAFYHAFLDQATPADGLRKLYVGLTRAMKSLTVTLPRYVRYTRVARMIDADATGFLQQFVEACDEVGIDREADPAQ